MFGIHVLLALTPIPLLQSQPSPYHDNRGHSSPLSPRVEGLQALDGARQMLVGQSILLGYPLEKHLGHFQKDIVSKNR